MRLHRGCCGARVKVVRHTYPPFRDTGDGSRQPPRRRSSVHPVARPLAFQLPISGEGMLPKQVYCVCACVRLHKGCCGARVKVVRHTYPPFRDTSDGSRQPPRRRSSVHPVARPLAFQLPISGRRNFAQTSLLCVCVCAVAQGVLRSSGKGSQAYVSPFSRHRRR